MDAVYGASDTNGRRPRSTKAAMETFRAGVYDLVETAEPCSVRHAYYLAATHGLVAKDVGGQRNNYTRVMRAISEMRESDEMPWDWIVDYTRLRRGPSLWRSSHEALQHWTRAYRRDLWQRQENYVEVWCESDSIAGTLRDVTEELGIDLMAIRGQSSKTFARSAVEQWMGDTRRCVVIYIGDFDPSGLTIRESLWDRIRRYGHDVLHDGQRLQFHRLAVMPWQISTLGLMGHEVNPKGPGHEQFEQVCDEWGLRHESVEAEAIDPNTMRDLLREAILRYVDQDAWERELTIEKAERDSLAAVRLPGYGASDA